MLKLTIPDFWNVYFCNIFCQLHYETVELIHYILELDLYSLFSVYVAYTIVGRFNIISFGRYVNGLNSLWKEIGGNQFGQGSPGDLQVAPYSFSLKTTFKTK